METRGYRGQDFEVPSAIGEGQYAASTRWRLLADGIAACIAHCPPERRAIVGSMQELWMMVEWERRLLQDPPPEGLFGG